MSQAPFVAKKLNHESNTMFSLNSNVFVKKKKECYCYGMLECYGCYLCLLLRSSVFLNDIPKNCVSPQPEKRIYFEKYL